MVNRFDNTDSLSFNTKALQFMEDLIMKHSNEGDVVLDTFAGSATTLLAAKNKNRTFQGCELDKDYYLKAKERLK